LNPSLLFREYTVKDSAYNYTDLGGAYVGPEQ